MLLNTRKKTWVKFNPGLSTNRPSNNWALVAFLGVPVYHRVSSVGYGLFYSITQRNISYSQLLSLFFLQDIFLCMLRNLFEEYRFFPQYPDKELHTTACLFGGIIEQGLVT